MQRAVTPPLLQLAFQEAGCITCWRVTCDRDTYTLTLEPATTGGASQGAGSTTRVDQRSAGTTAQDQAAAGAGTRRGPITELVAVLLACVPPLGAASPEDDLAVGPRPRRWSGEPVAVEDVLMLAELVHHGPVNQVAVALELAGLSDVPEWLREAAFGLAGSLTVSVTADGSTQVHTHAQLMPSGWFALSLDPEHRVTARPLSTREVRTSVQAACQHLMLAAADRSAA